MTKIIFDKEDVIIPVQVLVSHEGETKKLSLAMDTGSTYCTIPKDVAETLGIIPLGVISTATADRITYVQKTEVDSISVNGAKSEKVEAIIRDLPEQSYVDGLLGLSFLKNFELKISFREGFLEFAG